MELQVHAGVFRIVDEGDFGFVKEDLDVAVLEVVLGDECKVLIEHLLLKNPGVVHPVKAINLGTEDEALDLKFREELGSGNPDIGEEDTGSLCDLKEEPVLLWGFLFDAATDDDS